MVSTKTCPACEKVGKSSCLTFHRWENSADEYFRRMYRGTDSGVWYCCCGLCWIIKENAFFNATQLDQQVLQELESAETKSLAKEIFLRSKTQ